MSPLPLAEELDHPPVVGNRYRVRCVFVPKRIGLSRFRTWWPVWGTLHDDKEIGADFRHYHLFFPFLTDLQIDALHYYGYEHLGPAIAYFKPAISAADQRAERYENRFTLERIAVRRCRREWAEYPDLLDLRKRNELLRRYVKPLPPACRAHCPHRGMNLALVKPDCRGIITCPGHGLQWYASTGLPVLPEVEHAH